ncbi:MAG: hypothetical protein J1F02_00840 [Lachnospiraceae bacterium]|nr:hypothetical protein [Lachnospiraceae bacterium]
MKKAGLITIAVVLLAAGVILCYRLQGGGAEEQLDKGQGTLVKEHVTWKKFYI